MTTTKEKPDGTTIIVDEDERERNFLEVRCNANRCRFNKNGFCFAEGEPIQIMMVRRIPVCAEFEDKNKVIVEVPKSPNIFTSY